MGGQISDALATEATAAINRISATKPAGRVEEVLDEIYFYVRPQDRMERSWDDVPEEIKDTFEKLGIPEAERRILAGVGVV